MEKATITLNGGHAEGMLIELPSAPPLILAKGSRGVVFCGYLSFEAAERQGLAAAIVKGVSSVNGLLEKQISQWTSKAAALGVSGGMTGKEALEKLL